MLYNHRDVRQFLTNAKRRKGHSRVSSRFHLMTSSFPQASKLLAVLSALVIAGNVFLISAFVGSSIIDPNPFAFIGGFFVLPICIFLAVQQYRGTFRRVPSAAHATSMMLYIVGAFLLFGAATSTAETIQKGISLRLTAPFLVPMLAAAFSSIAIGKLNSRWCQSMLAAIESGAQAPVHRGFSLRELLLGVGIIAAMIGIGFHLIRTAPPRYAEGVDASAVSFDLPSGATDVSYGRGVRGTIAYEFTINEAAFRQWIDSGIGSPEAQSAGIPLEEITSRFTIPRYGATSPESKGPDEITINQGLYYSWSKEDRGVYAAFDRTTGRAYYHAHYH